MMPARSSRTESRSARRFSGVPRTRPRVRPRHTGRGSHRRVHGLLYPAAQRIEQRRRRQRGQAATATGARNWNTWVVSSTSPAHTPTSSPVTDRVRQAPAPHLVDPQQAVLEDRHAQRLLPARPPLLRARRRRLLAATTCSDHDACVPKTRAAPPPAISQLSCCFPSPAARRQLTTWQPTGRAQTAKKIKPAGAKKPRYAEWLERRS